MNSPDNPGRDAVVVAIDESSSCRAALGWAAHYARNTGAQLQAVYVLPYDFGSPLAGTAGLVAAMPPTFSDAEAELTQERLRAIFETLDPEPSWTLGLLKGAAGPELVRYTRNAQLLVMGTREHRGLERLTVGSASHYCVNHALCPTVVVPMADNPAAHELSVASVASTFHGVRG